MRPTVALYFDYASPWAYLAAELLERRLPGVAIDHRPVYLRGLESFAQGIPYTALKLRYIGLDLTRVAAHEQVPIRVPSVFPLNGLYALRGALHTLAHGGFADYHRALFRAAWRDDRDVSSREVVLAVAREAGQDSTAFARALDDPAIKERLKVETAAAAERGVFGVPTFVVGDELFWGQDRMDYVARAVARAAGC
jgi:2-hydroxychromene-2-carboxylate isomerase